MGSQTDKIQKALDIYSKSVKVIDPKKYMAIIYKHLDAEGRREFTKIATRKYLKVATSFKHFNKSWSKKNVLDIWKGDTWESVIDFCKLTNIKPKEVMNYVAGRKINKTDWKTIQIAKLVHATKSNLPLRSKAINLSKKLIAIDKTLAKRGERETQKHWQERIYQRVFKALQRYNL